MMGGWLMACMTGHGSSVGPGIMSVARDCGMPQRMVGSMEWLLCRSGMRFGQSLTLSPDQIEVATVHEQPGSLADDEDRVQPINRVGQEGEAARDREEPECDGNHALALPLGGDPLHQEAHREADLPEKAHRQPEVLVAHDRSFPRSRCVVVVGVLTIHLTGDRLTVASAFTVA